MVFNEPILKEGLNQVLAIAKARAQIIECLRQALLNDDDPKVKLYASQLCGLTNEGNRISQSIDTGTGQG